MVVSQPRLSKVVYTTVPDGGKVHTLIDSGVLAPQGVAADISRRLLYVVDPQSHAILKYNLVITGDKLAVDGEGVAAASGLESRWVAVDRGKRLSRTKG